MRVRSTQKQRPSSSRRPRPGSRGAYARPAASYSTSDPHGDGGGLFTAAQKKKALAPTPKAPVERPGKADVARAKALGAAAGKAAVDEAHRSGIVVVESLDRTHLDWKAGTAFAGADVGAACRYDFYQAFMLAADRRIGEILKRPSRNFSWPPR